jgi:DNA-binding SARP family transcriptional activator
MPDEDGCLRIDLFDGPRLVCGDRMVQRFRTQKTASLLAYLAYFPDRRHSREALSELLWPEGDRDSTRRSLSTALWSLRQQIGELGLPVEEILSVERGWVGFAAGRLVTDVHAFEAALEAARREADLAARADQLEAAVCLYRGELAPGLYEDWIFPEQARLAGLYHQALQELIEHLEGSGDLPAAVRFATGAVTADPLCEASRHRLMRILAASGHAATAHQHFREFERLVRRQLDMEPGPAISALAQELACQARNSRRIAVEVPAPAPPTGTEPPALESIGGAVTLDSRFYVERGTDREFHHAIAEGDSIVLVKGPRQSGKTSLLARGLQRAREAGARVAHTDFQSLTGPHVDTVDGVLLALAESLAEQVGLEVRPADGWNAHLGAGLNLRRFLRREVLPRLEAPLVWGLDEVDRLFPYPYAGEVFGVFRSWHNERALDPDGPWLRLTLAMAYATEAHLFLADLNQSPFNVGTRLELEDFTLEELAELNRRYGKPLAELDLRRLAELVGGHPYLARKALSLLSGRGSSLAELECGVAQGGGPFEDHLKRMLLALQRDAALYEAVRAFLRHGERPAEESFARLHSAGLLVLGTSGAVRWRCRLYEIYFARHCG